MIVTLPFPGIRDQFSLYVRANSDTTVRSGFSDAEQDVSRFEMARFQCSRWTSMFEFTRAYFTRASRTRAGETPERETTTDPFSRIDNRLAFVDSDGLRPIIRFVPYERHVVNHSRITV